MKFKTIMIVTFILVAVLSISMVSASQDADNLSDDYVLANNVDDVDLLSDGVDSVNEDEFSDYFQCYINEDFVDITELNETVGVSFYCPEGVEGKLIINLDEEITGLPSVVYDINESVWNTTVQYTVSDLGITEVGSYWVGLNFDDGSDEYWVGDGKITVIDITKIRVDDVSRFGWPQVIDEGPVFSLYYPVGSGGKIAEVYVKKGEGYVKSLSVEITNNDTSGYINWTLTELGVDSAEEYEFIFLVDNETIADYDHFEIGFPLLISDYVYINGKLDASGIASIMLDYEITAGQIIIIVNGTQSFNKSLDEIPGYIIGGGPNMGRVYYPIDVGELVPNVDVGVYEVELILICKNETINCVENVTCDKCNVSSDNDTNISVIIYNEDVILEDFNPYFVQVVTPKNTTGIVVINIDDSEYFNRSLSDLEEDGDYGDEVIYSVNVGDLDYLTPGTYEVNVTFYNENVTISSSETINFISIAEIEIISSDILWDDDDNYFAYVKYMAEDFGGGIEVYLNGTKYLDKGLDDFDRKYRSEINGSFYYYITPASLDDPVDPGTYDVVVISRAWVGTWVSENATLSFVKDSKENLEIEAFAEPITIGEDADVVVTGFEDATGNITVEVGDAIYTAPIVGGSAFVIVSGLCENSTAFVSYPGDDNYNNASVTVDIIVNRKNPEMEISPDAYEVNVGQKVNVAVILPEDATGEVMIGTEVVPVVNGTAIAAVPCLTVGNLTIPVVYYGDNQFNPITGEVNITVNYVPRQNATMNVAADEVSVGENTTVVVILPEDATGNVLIGNETVTVVNGTATASIPALVAGKFTLDVVYSGDEKYNSIEDSVNITIMGPDIIIAPDVVKYFHGAERFVVNVTDYMGNPLANKTVIITINGASYTRTTNENGSASIALGLGAGVYNVTSTVDNRTVDSVVTVLTTVNGTDVVKVFKNGTQYYATFKDSQGNYLAEGTTVRFNINGVFYDRQVSGDKGLARLNINLVQGEYILTAINPVTGEQSGNLITVIPKIVENRNVTKYFRNETQYTVKLLDDEGNPVGAGKEVTFNINGVFYKRTTNESGIAKMNINLNPGTYVITAQYDGCVVSNIIKVLPKLTASDLTKTFGNPDKFVATVVDGQGMPFADQSVTFNINGVLYNKTTNATGQAALNIYLIPGEYIITSMCNDEVISNKVTVIW